MSEHGFWAPQIKRPPIQASNLHWLVRYARHCGFKADGSTIEHALRSAFGAPAWRVVCRSQKHAFLPILRNRELSIHSLISYCKRLAERSFVTAPQPILLAFFTNQRRSFYNHSCRIPEPEDYDLIRVANRERSLCLRDIAVVANWVHQSRSQIRSAHRWSSLVLRARKHFADELVRAQSEDHEFWHFFCGPVHWRGLVVEPIRDSMGLWMQGHDQGNCLYKLRFDCGALQPSRFFVVRRGTKVMATLELAWRPPKGGDRNMDRVLGCWFLQDLRLTFNRLPDETLLNAMHDFASMYNTWAKRPGRLTDELIAETHARISRLQNGRSPEGWTPSFAL
jgi:hypothetical protein